MGILVKAFLCEPNRATGTAAISDMVPRCPVCGGPMAMHLRCDGYFVEDESWHKAADQYDSIEYE